MSLITKFTNIFSKTESTNLLCISLRNNNLSYCYAPSSFKFSHFENEAEVATSISELQTEEIPLIAGSYTQGIEKLLSQNNISGQCHLILNPKQYHLIQVAKPNVPEAELNGALKWQVKDLVPIAPENMVLDFFNSTDDEQVNVVCASLTELQTFVDVINKQNVTLSSITTPEFAFASLLPVSENAVMLVCQQADEEIFILVVQSGRILFYRHLRGFAQIAQKTEDELGYGIIDMLSLEIQKSSDFFERQLKQAAISEIKIIIPIEKEQYLAEKLANNTNVPLTLLDLPEQTKAQRNYATVLGAAMQHQQVNK